MLLIKSSRIYAHCSGLVEQADCENMFLQARPGKQGLGACEKFQILLLWSEVLTFTSTFTMSLLNKKGWNLESGNNIRPI